MTSPPDRNLPPHRADELTRPLKLNKWVVAAGAAVTAGMFAMLGYGIGRSSSGRMGENTPPSRLALAAPTLGSSGSRTLSRQIAMTPDGAGVVFVGEVNNENTLLYQRLDSDAPAIVPGGSRMISADVTPDGRSVIGIASENNNRSNRKLALRGGATVELPEEVNAAHFSMTRDGSIWYSSADNAGLYRVSPKGNVELMRKAENQVRLQQMLDDGKRALVVIAPPGIESGPAAILDIESGSETQLTSESVVEARIAAGHLVYVRGDGTLWAAPFDEMNQRTTAPPVQIGSDVSLTGTGVAQLAVARNGNVAFIPDEPRWLVFVDRNGRLRNATSERRNYHSPRFSPDGRRVSVDFTGTDGRDVWILSVEGGSLSRATFDRDAQDATWAPDGEHITYTSFTSGSLGVYQVRPGNTAPRDSMLAAPTLAYTGEWLRDGSGLVTTATNLRPGAQPDIALISNNGRGPVVPIVVNEFVTQYPAVSPDSRWLAYVSNHSGRDEVYVRPWQRNGNEVLVSQNGGSEPVWSRDGKELFYRGNVTRRPDMIVAAVRTSPDFEVISRKVLFPAVDIVTAAVHRNYDISPDGRTFVMVRRSPANRIMVLQNLAGVVRDARQQPPSP